MTTMKNIKDRLDQLNRDKKNKGKIKILISHLKDKNLTSEQLYSMFLKTSDEILKSAIVEMEQKSYTDIPQDKKKFCIYCITFPDGKKYVGQTMSVERAVMSHRYEVYKTSKNGYCYNKLLESKNKLIAHKVKFQNDRIDFEILETPIGGHEEDKDRLIRWIEKLNTFENGLNSNKGVKSTNGIFKIDENGIPDRVYEKQRQKEMSEIIRKEREEQRKLDENDTEEIKDGKRIYRQTPGLDFGMGKYIGEGMYIQDDGTFYHDK